MRLPACAPVVGIPVGFPRLKVALLKWAYSQMPMLGSCPMPPSLEKRLHTMDLPQQLIECENLVAYFHKTVATLVPGLQLGAVFDRVKLLAVIDTGFVAAIAAQPKYANRGKLAEDFAKHVAITLRHIAKMMCVAVVDLPPRSRRWTTCRR